MIIMLAVEITEGVARYQEFVADCILNAARNDQTIGIKVIGTGTDVKVLAAEVLPEGVAPPVQEVTC